MKITETDIEQAERTLRASYWQDVRRYAEYALEALAKAENSIDADLSNAVEQVIDGVERVIYTHKAIDTLRWSEHAEEEFQDVYGDDWHGRDDSSIESLYCRIAFFGLRRDVLDTALAMQSESEVA